MLEESEEYGDDDNNLEGFTKDDEEDCVGGVKTAVQNEARDVPGTANRFLVMMAG